MEKRFAEKKTRKIDKTIAFDSKASSRIFGDLKTLIPQNGNKLKMTSYHCQIGFANGCVVATLLLLLLVVV